MNLLKKSLSFNCFKASISFSTFALAAFGLLNTNCIKESANKNESETEAAKKAQKKPTDPSMGSAKDLMGVGINAQKLLVPAKSTEIVSSPLNLECSTPQAMFAQIDNYMSTLSEFVERNKTTCANGTIQKEGILYTAKEGWKVHVALGGALTTRNESWENNVKTVGSETSQEKWTNSYVNTNLSTSVALQVRFPKKSKSTTKSCEQPAGTPYVKENFIESITKDTMLWADLSCTMVQFGVSSEAMVQENICDAKISPSMLTKMESYEEMNCATRFEKACPADKTKPLQNQNVCFEGTNLKSGIVRKARLFDGFTVHYSPASAWEQSSYGLSLNLFSATWGGAASGNSNICVNAKNSSRLKLGALFLETRLNQLKVNAGCPATTLTSQFGAPTSGAEVLAPKYQDSQLKLDGLVINASK